MTEWRRSEKGRIHSKRILKSLKKTKSLTCGKNIDWGGRGLKVRKTRRGTI